MNVYLVCLAYIGNWLLFSIKLSALKMISLFSCTHIRDCFELLHITSSSVIDLGHDAFI